MNGSHRVFVTGAILVACYIAGCAIPASNMVEENLSLAVVQDQLAPLNPGSWKPATVEGRECLMLDVPGKQRPPVRRPGEYALWNGGAPMQDFTVTVEACSLEPASKKGRDVCILFGFQDDTHFYYAHISNDSNGKFHNVILKVQGDVRQRINLEDLPEPRLDDGWHAIKVRHLATGDITVWVDDMTAPLMTARDTTYTSGGIGFGSFDDHAAFSTLRLRSIR